MCMREKKKENGHKEHAESAKSLVHKKESQSETWPEIARIGGQLMANGSDGGREDIAKEKSDNDFILTDAVCGEKRLAGSQSGAEFRKHMQGNNAALLRRKKVSPKGMFSKPL